MLLPRHQESLHLREAGGVTAGLMEMGASLSPATYAILSGAPKTRNLKNESRRIQ
jgi:hypothetical protein